LRLVQSINAVSPIFTIPFPKSTDASDEQVLNAPIPITRRLSGREIEVMLVDSDDTKASPSISVTPYSTITSEPSDRISAAQDPVSIPEPEIVTVDPETL
jgi:hypothetical protein